jgi:hypothetical protein
MYFYPSSQPLLHVYEDMKKVPFQSKLIMASPGNGATEEVTCVNACHTKAEKSFEKSPLKDNFYETESINE